MGVSDAKRLRALEENAKLEKLLGTCLLEAKPYARWSLDCLHDQFASGPRFRVLNVVNDGRRVARGPTVLVVGRNKPDMIVCDHGAEFTLNAILAWSKDHRVEWHPHRARQAQTATSNSSTAECVTNFEREPVQW